MTNTGRVEAIHIAPAAEAPMTSLERVHAVAGVGLEGDRYAARRGTWSPDPPADRDITLIEAEVLEDLAATDGIVLRSEEHTSELQSPCNLVCRLLLEKKKTEQTARERRARRHLGTTA